MSIIELVIKIVFISFSEQLVITLLSLKFLKAYDILNPQSLYKLLLVSLIPSVMSYIPIALNINPNLKMVIGIFVTIFFLRCVTKKNFSKVIISVLVSFVIFLTTEYICVITLIYATGITTDIIGSRIVYTLLVAFFERIIQFALLYLLYIKIKGSKANLDIFDIIIRSKRKRNLAIIMLFSIIVFLSLLGWTFMFNKILEDLSPLNAILICIFSILLPFASIYSFLETTYHDYINADMYIEHFSNDIKERCDYAIECAKNAGDIKTMEAITKIYQPLE